MRPQRVLHVISKMDRGGAESLVMGIYRHVDRSRVQFDFAVDDDRADFTDEIRDLGGRSFVLPRPARGLRPFLAGLRETIETRGPYRAVHSHVHFFSGAVLAVARRTGVPIRIAQSHTTEDERSNSLARRTYRAAMRRLLAVSATDRVACAPRAAAALFGPRESDWTLVPNAIDLDAAAAAAGPGAGSALREQLGIDRSATVIVHVGGFRAVKNQSFVVDVFHEVARVDAAAHLVFAGDGPLRSEVEERVRSLDLVTRTRFLGKTRDIWSVFAAADAGVFPSRYEGVSIAMVEAQAAGVPLVVSRSVDPEVDLGLGLVRWSEVSAEPGAWAHEVDLARRTPVPPWPERRETLARRGYDLAVVAATLQDVYLGE